MVMREFCKTKKSLTHFYDGLKTFFEIIYGDKGARTPDLYAASVALSQLSYTPGKLFIQ